MKDRITLVSIIALLASVALALGADNPQAPSQPVKQQVSAQSEAVIESAKPAAPVKEEAPSSPKQVLAASSLESSNLSLGQRNDRGSDHRDDHGRGYSPRGYWNDRGSHHGNDYWRPGYFRGYWDFSVVQRPIVVPYPVTVPYPATAPWRGARVCVVYAGNDIVGSTFVNSVKDHLQASGLILVSTPDDASLELYVTSMDIDPAHPGYSCAAAISYVAFPGNQFLSAQMLNVGALQIGPRASSVAAYALQLIEQYRY
jgi:hypothetical protein